MSVLENKRSAVIQRTGRDSAVRVSGIVDQSIVDGPGLRLTVFTQGCPHACPGCHNPATHALDQGFDLSVQEILARFDDNPLLAGITLSGGEPLIQASALLPLARQVKARDKSVWCYTGFTFEQLLGKAQTDRSLHQLLQHIDVLVDGRYIASQRSLTLRFRGSANQRVLDLPQSLALETPVHWHSPSRAQTA